MINVNNISFSYGEKHVIKDFSLKISEKDRVCIFGESGCGKTTLLRILLGLEIPQSGGVDGIERLKSSVVFQENRLLPFKTVLQNITVIGADENTAIFHLTALGLSDVCNEYPAELSGGMQRRAAIARALSADYDYLVLDEPFTGLDKNNIISAARHMSQSLGDRPLIMVSHSESEAELLGARIINI